MAPLMLTKAGQNRHVRGGPSRDSKVLERQHRGRDPVFDTRIVATVDDETETRTRFTLRTFADRISPADLRAFQGGSAYVVVNVAEED